MAELEDLISRCQGGELAAFGELFRRFEARIFRLALTILHDEPDAEDAVQDSFLRIFEHIERYRAESSFETWLTAVVVNVCRDRLRRQGVRHALRLRLGRREGSPRLDRGQVLDRVAAHQERQALWAMVGRLEERQRLAVVLRYHETLSCAEIAGVLGVPVRTVYGLLDSGRSKLQAMIREERNRLEGEVERRG